jgi:uncharacterized protein YndB with AHSA1/START domain
MSETGSQAKRSIVVDYDLPHPPEKVWRALTDGNLLAEWLMPNDFRPLLGHRFTFRTRPMPGFDGIIHCEVLELEPPARLRYSWRGGSGENALDTIVTWTLQPGGSGTRLQLEHAGFTAANEFAFRGMDGGWRGPIADRMKEILKQLQ